MKKILILALAFALVASIALAAPTVNFADYTDDELRELKTSVSLELASRSVAAKEKEGACAEGEILDVYIRLDAPWAAAGMKDEPAVALGFDWINRAQDPKDFVSAVEVKLYQDGVELQDAGGSAKGFTKGTAITKIQPGTEFRTECAWILRSDSPIEVEIRGRFDLVNPTYLKATVPCP